MAKAGRDPKDLVKTTVELPASLWRAAKIRAMDERVDLRTVLVQALEQFLRQPEPPASGRIKNRS